MFILIDSREHKNKIAGIKKAFARGGADFDVCKLYVGDYMDFANPSVIIDRKQHVDELAKNCTAEQTRFRNELERVKRCGAEMVILVEQDTVKTHRGTFPLRKLDDLILWESQYSEVSGERVYRILNAWVHKYPVTVEFCNKRDTGRRILEILGGRHER